MMNVIRRHWKKISWAAIGTPLGILGTQLEMPEAKYCYIAAAFCAIMAGVYIPRAKK